MTTIASMEKEETQREPDDQEELDDEKIRQALDGISSIAHSLKKIDRHMYEYIRMYEHVNYRKGGEPEQD